ncbi:MAG: MFS transporter [Ilumatobacteraceae bacterium]
MTTDSDLPLRRSSLAVSTWALFVGLALVLCGVGLFGTVVGIRSELNGFSDVVIGLIGAAYYGGFLIGSTLTLGWLVTVGHIRVFAAMSSLLATVMIVAGLSATPVTWLIARFLSGVLAAGLYVVAESWLNGLASNETRGRLLGIYLVVTGAAYGLGQVLAGYVRPATLTAFAVGAMLTGAAVAPVALSEAATAPSVDDDERVSLRALAQMVPTGVGTVLLVGLTHGAFVALAVVYATRDGVSPAAAGWFAAVAGVGGVVFQWPLSAASDQMDRRFVGTFIAIAAAAACLWLILGGPQGWSGHGAMFVIGGFSFPLYSIGAAYTNDWVEPHQQSAASSQVVLLYGVGALLGPPIASASMAVLGADGYPWAMLLMHLLIATFLVYRMLAWRAPIAKTTWADASLSARVFFVPANVVWAGRRLRAGRHRR